MRSAGYGSLGDDHASASFCHFLLLLTTFCDFLLRFLEGDDILIVGWATTVYNMVLPLLP